MTKYHTKAIVTVTQAHIAVLSHCTTGIPSPGNNVFNNHRIAGELQKAVVILLGKPRKGLHQVFLSKGKSIRSMNYSSSVKWLSPKQTPIRLSQVKQISSCGETTGALN